MPDIGGNSGAQLKSYIERVEKLREEIKTLNEDVSEVYKEAKSAGFIVKVMKELVKLRAMNADDLAEQEAILDIYKRCLGMLPESDAP